MIALAMALVAVLGVAVLASMRRARSGSEPARPLVTRGGQPARGDAVVADSLVQLHAYMALGSPSSLVRGRVLSAELARRLGKDGRARLADVLDHTREVMAYRRSRWRSRVELFQAIERLNALLEERGLGYYVYALFEWDAGHRRVEQVVIEPLAIEAVREYRVGEGAVRALHVGRVGAARVQPDKLGFASPDIAEVFVLPAAIDQELARGLWPARDPASPSTYFAVAAAEQDAGWYRRLRQAMATAMAEELAHAADPERALREALIASVERHEIQHKLDFAADRPVRGVFHELGIGLGDERHGRSCMHETSAHLAQLAHTDMPRTILGQIVSYTFRRACLHASCTAALAILDELAAELEDEPLDPLLARQSYALSSVAERYARLAARPSAAVRDAARRAWERLFDAPLPEVEERHGHGGEALEGAVVPRRPAPRQEHGRGPLLPP